MACCKSCVSFTRTSFYQKVCLSLLAVKYTYLSFVMIPVFVDLKKLPSLCVCEFPEKVRRDPLTNNLACQLLGQTACYSLIFSSYLFNGRLIDRNVGI
jgi:hypothetical protein